MKVRLLKHNLEPIAFVEIPDFTVPPQVLISGSRAFVAFAEDVTDADKVDYAVYQETDVYFLKGEIEMGQSLGEISYEAYRAHSGGKSLVSGQEIPAFDKLPDSIKQAWNAAGKAVADAIIQAAREI